MTAPDPFDVGALLSAAVTASGFTPAEVARRAGIAAPHVYRALRDPNCRAPTARKILTALGSCLVLAPKAPVGAARPPDALPTRPKGARPGKPPPKPAVAALPARPTEWLAYDKLRTQFGQKVGGRMIRYERPPAGWSRLPEDDDAEDSP